MAKYTDEQIKKALKCCGEDGCGECPVKCLAKYDIGCELYSEKLYLLAFDIINRQEAEKAELQLEITNCNSKIEKLKEKNRLANQCTPKAIRRARAEAIKEFAERLKSYLLLYKPNQMSVISLENIDNLVKEMVGESNA